MFDIEKSLRENGLTVEDYEEALDFFYKKTQGETQLDWADLADMYGLDYSAESIRKAQQLPLFGGAFIKQYMEEKAEKEPSPSFPEPPALAGGCRVDEKLREIEQAKILYREERNAWQKQNRSAARTSAFLDGLAEALKKESEVRFGNVECEPEPWPELDDRTMIICLSDWHIGANFGNACGAYNAEIAKKRLDLLLLKIKEINRKQGVKQAVVVSLGDQINGNIHKSIQVTNRENVIDQVKKATDLMSEFCLALCSEFDFVRFFSVAGNHSRMDKKEDALHDERLDDIVTWATGLKLSSVPNFEVDCERWDSGLDYFTIGECDYVIVHGDMDTCSPNSVANLSAMIGFVPHCIIKGHKHSPSQELINNVRVIQSGSLIGTGDQYTLEKRLYGMASQTIIVTDDMGEVDCVYNPDLEWVTK